jgi:hypothetical protein
MRVSKLLFLGALVGCNIARAVVVEFHGAGTYGAWNGETTVQVPFSVDFAYNTGTAHTAVYDTQKLYPALYLSLNISFLGGTSWSHTSTDVGVTVTNGAGGAADSLQISTREPMTGVPNFGYPGESGGPYAVRIFTFELTKNSGGFFPGTDLSLPTSPTFYGNLADWNVKNAKMYITTNGTNYIAHFNAPLTSLGAPSPIPEPSAWAMMAGAMALGVVLWQRHRAAKVVSD